MTTSITEAPERAKTSKKQEVDAALDKVLGAFSEAFANTPDETAKPSREKNLKGGSLDIPNFSELELAETKSTHNKQQPY